MQHSFVAGNVVCFGAHSACNFWSIPAHAQETKMVFEKLYKFVGKNIKNLVDRQDEPYTFRLQKNRVYYVKESLMKKSTNVSCILVFELEMLFAKAHPSSSGVYCPKPTQGAIARILTFSGCLTYPTCPASYCADCTRQTDFTGLLHRKAYPHRQIQADHWGFGCPLPVCQVQGGVVCTIQLTILI